MSAVLASFPVCTPVAASPEVLAAVAVRVVAVVR